MLNISNSSDLHFLSNSKIKILSIYRPIYVNTCYLCSMMSPFVTSVNQFLTTPQIGKWAIPSSTSVGDTDMRPLRFLWEI